MSALALTPPVAPMLGRLARELPHDGFLCEPKWDGFRCLAFCSEDGVANTVVLVRLRRGCPSRLLSAWDAPRTGCTVASPSDRGDQRTPLHLEGIRRGLDAPTQPAANAVTDSAYGTIAIADLEDLIAARRAARTPPPGRAQAGLQNRLSAPQQCGYLHGRTVACGRKCADRRHSVPGFARQPSPSR